MKKNMWIVLFYILIFLATPVGADAAKDMYVHHGIDGTVSFFVPERDTNFWNGKGMTIEFHKIFSPDKIYYAMKAGFDRSQKETFSIAGVTLIVDGEEICLSQLEGARKDEIPDFVQEWYAVNEEFMNKITKATELNIIVKLSNGKEQKDKVYKTYMEALQRLVNTSKEENHNAKPLDDDFAMFIPGFKPIEVGPALVFHTNYIGGDGFKTYFLDAYGVKKSKDWSSIYFVTGREFYSVLNYINLQQHDGGTWLFSKMGLSRYRNSYENMSHDFIKAGNDEVRDSYMWVQAMIDTYQSLHGKYDYGLNWDPSTGIENHKKYYRAKWKTGPFTVQKVNIQKFPELADVKVGDTIVQINDRSTSSLNYMDSLLTTVCEGRPAVFTIKDSAGNQKVVTVQPKFTPANPQKINYLELIDKDKRQFLGEWNSPIRSYNPLGSGPQ